MSHRNRIACADAQLPGASERKWTEWTSLRSAFASTQSTYAHTLSPPVSFELNTQGYLLFLDEALQLFSIGLIG